MTAYTRYTRKATSAQYGRSRRKKYNSRRKNTRARRKSYCRY